MIAYFLISWGIALLLARFWLSFPFSFPSISGHAGHFGLAPRQEKLCGEWFFWTFLVTSFGTSLTLSFGLSLGILVWTSISAPTTWTGGFSYRGSKPAWAAGRLGEILEVRASVGNLDTGNNVTISVFVF